MIAVATAIVIVIALTATAVVWHRANRDVAIAQDRLGPVLLVPGRVADSEELVDLQHRLFLAGRRALIVSVGTGDSGDLKAQAQQIGRTADQLLDQGAPSVDVVGYSAGGVVTRLWLADGGADIARRVVTLGSPNAGAGQNQLNHLVTKRLCDVTCPQLTPGSPLLTTLPQIRVAAPWLNVWTTSDKVVSTPSARLPGALNVSLQSICADDRSGHSGLSSDPLTIGLVLRALSPEPLTSAPTQAECDSLRGAGSPDLLPEGS
jgi:triacylglycerol lipase